MWVILLTGAGCVYAGSRWLEAGPVEVAVARASFEDVDASVSTSGKVVPVSEFQARASFAGVVEKVFVQVGDQVRPGQMLVKMKDSFALQRLAAATVGVDTAKVNSENIERNGSQEDRIASAGERQRALLEQTAATNGLATAKALEATGAASPAEVNGATRRLEEANVTLQTLDRKQTDRYSAADRVAWKARLAEAKAGLAAEKVSFANANIVSPIAGTVNLVPVTANDFVGAGADLLHVADLNRIEIRAYFDEPDIGKLHVGQIVRVTWEGRPNETWTGHIKYAPLAVMALGKRSVGDCTISVDDPKQELLPNTSVNVSTVFERRTNVLTVPREALHTDGAATFVYRVSGERLVRTPVEVGVLNLEHVEVKKGIGPNEEIALHTLDNSNLRHDLRVRASR